MKQMTIKCDRCPSEVQGDHDWPYKLPNGWFSFELNGLKFDLCHECARFVVEFVKKGK